MARHADPGNIWFIGEDQVRPVLSLGNAFPVFSPDCRWMVSVDSNGTRLWRLDAEIPDDRGVLGPNGSVHFTRDSKHLLILASGQINQYTLSLDQVIKKAEDYVGRNLAWEEWSSEFPQEEYRTAFYEYPPHLSFIENLVLRGQQAAQKGDDGVATKAFREAAEAAIENRSVYACMGVIEAGIRAGNASAVISAANYAITVLPDSASLYDLRGKARAASGDFNGAVSDFEIMIKKSTNDKEKIQRQNWIKRLKLKQSIPIEELMKVDWDFSE